MSPLLRAVSGAKDSRRPPSPDHSLANLEHEVTASQVGCAIDRGLPQCWSEDEAPVFGDGNILAGVIGLQRRPILLVEREHERDTIHPRAVA